MEIVVIAAAISAALPKKVEDMWVLADAVEKLTLADDGRDRKSVGHRLALRGDVSLDREVLLREPPSAIRNPDRISSRMNTASLRCAIAFTPAMKPGAASSTSNVIMITHAISPG